MSTVSIRISREAHRKLTELARDRGQTISATIEDIAEEERRRAFWVAAQRKVLTLREDPTAWDDYQTDLQEIDELDLTEDIDGDTATR